jgi:putative hydrolase of HD superfamily
MADRLGAQFAFLNEADKLKTVLRGTTLNDGSRKENSGEHSWHIALYALVLAEHANRPVNIDRVIRMLLIHDLVEIDAGDNPIHGNHDPVAMARIEEAAADRLFGLLPTDQGTALRALWEEFEAAETDDAIFAKSIDRVQPVLSNLESGGHSWIDFDVTRTQVETRVGTKVQRGAPALWNALKERIDHWFATHRPHL